MVTIARPRVCPVLLLLAAIMLVHPPSARADRIDINDPTLLGPVLFSEDYGEQHSAHWIAEVRYAAGIYSYVYAIQTSPSFPEEENQLVSFAVGPNHLENSWGAIHGSDEHWPHDDTPSGLTNQVARISAIRDFLFVFPVFAPEFTYTVIYTQSLLPPSRHGALGYNAHGSRPDGSQVNGFTGADGVLAPVPEPGTIGLFGLGLAGLAAKLRANRHRRVARAR